MKRRTILGSVAATISSWLMLGSSGSATSAKVFFRKAPPDFVCSKSGNIWSSFSETEYVWRFDGKDVSPIFQSLEEAILFTGYPNLDKEIPKKYLKQCQEQEAHERGEDFKMSGWDPVPKELPPPEECKRILKEIRDSHEIRYPMPSIPKRMSFSEILSND